MSYTHMWDEMRERDPEHSARYAQRWRDLAAQGLDLDGEARFVDALAERGSRILDAGCGTGRVGGYLAERGHEVVGVDLDDYLIAEAQETYPGADWYAGDLARFDFAALDEGRDMRDLGAQASTDLLGRPEAAPESDRPGFDVIVSAGNVMTFLDPASRSAVMGNLAGALRPDGRLVCGFGAGRGYDFDDFDADLAAAGLTLTTRFSTWTLRPFTDPGDFLVAIAAPGR